MPHAKQGRNAPVRRGRVWAESHMARPRGAWHMAAARNGSPIGAGAHGGAAATKKATWLGGLRGLGLRR